MHAAHQAAPIHRRHGRSPRRLAGALGGLGVLLGLLALAPAAMGDTPGATTSLTPVFDPLSAPDAPSAPDVPGVAPTAAGHTTDAATPESPSPATAATPVPSLTPLPPLVAKPAMSAGTGGTDATPPIDETDSSPPSPSLAPLPLARAPHVAIGYARSLRGGRVPKGVDVAVRSVRSAIEACYADAIVREGEGEGSLELRLELVGPGRVASATVQSSVELSATLRGCVRDAFVGVRGGAVGPAPIEVLVSIGFTRSVAEDQIRPPTACPSTCDTEPDEEVRRAVRARAAHAASCFKRAAKAGERPRMKAGRLEVLVRLAEDGNVCGTAVAGDTLERPSLTTCVLETMSRDLPVTPKGCTEIVVPFAYRGN